MQLYGGAETVPRLLDVGVALTVTTSQGHAQCHHADLQQSIGLSAQAVCAFLLTSLCGILLVRLWSRRLAGRQARRAWPLKPMHGPSEQSQEPSVTMQVYSTGYVVTACLLLLSSAFPKKCRSGCSCFALAGPLVMCSILQAAHCT